LKKIKNTEMIHHFYQWKRFSSWIRSYSISILLLILFITSICFSRTISSEKAEIQIGGQSQNDPFTYITVCEE
ncbi:MAG: hypothetical protein RID25_03840, partial [Cyclobacteriaceae bacterium]